MATCREILTFTWPLRGRGGREGRPTQAVSLTIFSQLFYAFPKYFLKISQNILASGAFFQNLELFSCHSFSFGQKNAGYIVVTTEQMVCILWWCHHFEMWLIYRDLVKTLNCFLYFMILQIFWNFVIFLAGQYFNISKFSGFLISLKVGIIELFYIS